MILVALVLVPLLGGVLAWIAGRGSPAAPRWIALAALAVDVGLALVLLAGGGSVPATAGSAAAGAPGAAGDWIAYAAWSWIPRFGIGLRFGVDGISLLLVLLTGLLGLLAVGCSWSEITERVGFFHFNLLWVLAGVIGVFLALDLFLFYFFWELMLVPMYLLIGIWGHENRIYAALKFFIFTQASGLLMLVSILGLGAAHAAATGEWTFDYLALLETPVTGPAAVWLMLGFFVAFVVKLPAVPFHTWLPDAHTEAPTAGSVVLAGLLLKTGGYGLLRFAVPLFPQASAAWAPVAMALGAVGILYGAWVAFGQNDLKRLVAYTSVSHLGFVLLGVYAWNELALQGVVLQMICHGLSTGALFILVGQIQERTGTRDLDRLGGLWGTAPRMAGLGLLFALASLGLPGLGNFVAEILTLLGAWRVSVVWTALATVGLVLATVYSLRIVQGVFHGEDEAGWRIADLGGREVAVLGVAAGMLLWLGVWPGPVIGVVDGALEGLAGPGVGVGAEEGEGVVEERAVAGFGHRPGPAGAPPGDGSEARGSKGGPRLRSAADMPALHSDRPREAAALSPAGGAPAGPGLHGLTNVASAPTPAEGRGEGIGAVRSLGRGAPAGPGLHGLTNVASAPTPAEGRGEGIGTARLLERWAPTDVPGLPSAPASAEGGGGVLGPAPWRSRPLPLSADRPEPHPNRHPERERGTWAGGGGRMSTIGRTAATTTTPLTHRGGTP